MSEDDIKALIKSIIKDAENSKETWTAMVSRIEDALKALHSDLEIQHRDMFSQLTRMEIDGAIVSHRRQVDTDMKDHPHKRIADPGAWKEKLLIAALAGMAGTHVIEFFASVSGGILQ